MATVLGSAGLSLIGDKSVEFYRDVIGFVDRRIAQHKSRIFLSRLLNKPTIFVASNTAIKQLLNEHSDCLELGYKAFMHQIYGDNILFSDGHEAEAARQALITLLGDHQSVTHIQDVINLQIDKNLAKIESGSPVAVYETMKRLCTEICLSLFLGINFEGSAELAAQIVALTTTHWHGIISMPVRLSVGLSKSTFSRALEAKRKLLEIINEKLEGKPSAFTLKMRDVGFRDRSQTANHLLLFTSALVPKALASLLTSFVLATCRQEHLQRDLLVDEDLLDYTLLEVQRLSPPFIGGRRIIKQAFELEGLQFPEGHAVVYLTHHAHRDPGVFDEPDTFKPTRWRYKNKDDRDCVYALGSGPRDCVGKHLVAQILRSICRQLMDRYTWVGGRETESDIAYKWLPVTRPREAIKVTFHSKRSSTSQQDPDTRHQEQETNPQQEISL